MSTQYYVNCVADEEMHNIMDVKEINNNILLFYF